MLLAGLYSELRHIVAKKKLFLLFDRLLQNEKNRKKKFFERPV